MSRIAVVTGGTRGIGRAISVALKAAGYRVIANYFGNVDAATAFTQETKIPTARFDVSNFAACDEAVKKIVADHGPIEILVNNAGITRDATLQRMSYEQWEEVIHTNLTSCFNMCRAVIESMRQRGFGRIVNIGSINGQAGQYGQVNYAAAKSGIHGFTKALAQEGAAKGITVNAIAPGIIATRMSADSFDESAIARLVPMRRAGTAIEVASLVGFLCSEGAGYITGQVVSINGGMY